MSSPLLDFVFLIGNQGSGKSLSAINYLIHLHDQYPKLIIVTNMYLFMYFGLEEIDVRYFTKEELNSLNMKARLLFFQLKDRLSKKEMEQYRLYKSMLDPYNYVFSSLKSIFYQKEPWILEYKGLESLMNIQNDELGVLYFIDEFLTLFNSIKSKDMDLEDFEAICQLRKQHKRIISCAQVFGRIAKGWREQCKEIIVCKNFLGLIQFNQLIDGTEIDPNDKNSNPPVKQSYIWFHTRALYNSYDTYQVVRKNGVDYLDESFTEKTFKQQKRTEIKENG